MLAYQLPRSISLHILAYYTHNLIRGYAWDASNVYLASFTGLGPTDVALKRVEFYRNSPNKKTRWQTPKSTYAHTPMEKCQRRI